MIAGSRYPVSPKVGMPAPTSVMQKMKRSSDALNCSGLRMQRNKPFTTTMSRSMTSTGPSGK
ncbi:MAG: hypothetical protein ACD_75C01202G0001 [uncultured bacterium]|nr:MAG: hypothetical protein ACD_75C01202G0001 [uncultured bacterium]